MAKCSKCGGKSAKKEAPAPKKSTGHTYKCGGKIKK